MAANGTPEEGPAENQQTESESDPQSPNPDSLTETTSPAPTQTAPPSPPRSSNRNLLLIGGIVGGLVLVVVVAGVLFTMLSGGGPPSGNSALSLAPEDTEELVTWNIQVVLEGTIGEADPDADPDEVVHRLLWNLDRDFVDIEDISQFAWVAFEDGLVGITSLNSNFDVVREELEDFDWEEDTYRGYEVWASGNRSFALLEKEGQIIEGRPDSVEKVLNNHYRERGSLAEAEDSDLKRIVDRLEEGAGLWVNAEDGVCDRVSRCQGVGLSFLSYDLDDEVVLCSYVLLFSSERSAESAADEFDEVSGYLESIGDLDIDDAESDGEFVVGTGRIGARYALDFP